MLMFGTYSRVLLALPSDVNKIAAIGALATTGDSTPLKNPLIPSYLYIVLTVGIKWTVSVLPNCILTLTVSRGCDTMLDTIPAHTPETISI